MSVLEDLIAGKARIDTPEKWCKGQPTKGAAVCAGRSLFIATRDGSYRAAAAALKAAIPPAWVKRHGREISVFNDHPDTTHADIMALFDRAIAAQPGAAE